VHVVAWNTHLKVMKLALPRYGLEPSPKNDSVGIASKDDGLIFVTGNCPVGLID